MKDQDKVHQKLAEEVRQACLNAAKEGFRDASMSGLCSEGAIEAAVGSIQKIDLSKIISRFSA